MLALSLEIEQCDTDRPASKSRFCQKMEIEQNNSQVAICLHEIMNIKHLEVKSLPTSADKWHCLHSANTAAFILLRAGRAAIDRYLLPAELTAANQQ